VRSPMRPSTSPCPSRCDGREPARLHHRSTRREGLSPRRWLC
jgi:hypothetical protein